MSIRSHHDMHGMQAVSNAVATTLKQMQIHARPGMSTKDLDRYGEAVLNNFGAVSAPYKCYGFPGCCCISINRVVAHGIPSHKIILQEGDLVNIDVSAELNGYFADNGASFVLGADRQNLSPLVEASRTILTDAITRIQSGVKIASIGKYIEKQARKRGFTTIKNLVGHGVGRALHEAPFELPNFHDRHNKQKFSGNTVIALETFISTRARFVEKEPDGWGLQPPFGSFVAQHEHTLIVTDNHPVILTRENGI